MSQGPRWPVIQDVTRIHNKGLSNRAKFCATFRQNDLCAQYTAGRGIGCYELNTIGLGLDGQVDPLTGLFNVINETALLVSYEHWFTESWMAQGTWSETQVGHDGFQPGSTYAGAKCASVG